MTTPHTHEILPPNSTHGPASQAHYSHKENRMTDSSYEHQAYELGVEHAKNAAGWIIDGNTKREFIPAVLQMFDDGDPRVDEYLPATPNLSGEWADSMTPDTLHREITGGEEPREDKDEFLSALCEAYEQGVSDTFYAECERILRDAIA